MEDPHRPPLGADIYEAIALAQYEVDQKYWAELQPLRVSSLALLNADLKGQPLPPKQSLHLLKILGEYAGALFDVEARKYPPGPELARWLLDLGERIEARVLESLQPNFSGTLAYHATAEEMGKAVHNPIKSHIEDSTAGSPRIPPPLMSTGAVQLPQTAVGQPEPPGEVQRGATIREQIEMLRNECRFTVEDLAEAIRVSTRSVYRHLSGDADPRQRHLAAYEKVFSEKLKRQVHLQCQQDVVRQQNVTSRHQ